ncbi:unnamed protein product, partial [Staurois parvus]
DDDKIVGGYTCTKNSIPYQVSLNAGYHFCGGSLLNSLWVLSAAHCYMSSMQVRPGEHNIAASEGAEQFIDAARIIRHASYNSRTLDNDIMLVKLTSPCLEASSIFALLFSISNIFLFPFILIIFILSLFSPLANYPDLLQCLNAPVLTTAQCNSAYPGEITGNMICVGYMEGGKDSCQGDSGGPRGLQWTAPGCCLLGIRLCPEELPWCLRSATTTAGSIQAAN